MIKLVIFDCDGVLVDSEHLSARVLIGALAEAGVSVDLDHFERHFLGRSFPVVVEAIRRDFGRALPKAFEATYGTRLLELFEQELRPTDGLAQVLSRLAVPACVATSSNRTRAERSLRIAGLWKRFADHVFTVAEVARGKPDPDLFLHVAAKSGVPPQDCLVIEDSAPGLEAAAAAGMASLHYAGGGHLLGRGVGREASMGCIRHWGELDRVCPDLLLQKDPV